MAESNAAGAEKLLAGTVLTVAKQLILGGITPTNAVKLAGPALILAALDGRVLRDLGVPERTVYQWQQDITAAAAGGPDYPPAEVVNELLTVMGLPFRVVVDQ